MRVRSGKVSVGFIVVACVAVVATPAVFFGLKMTTKNRRMAEVREGAGADLLRTFPLHDENVAYFEWLIDQAHPVAFRESYASGGLFSPAEWSEPQYNRALGDEMVRIMRESGEPQYRELGDQFDAHLRMHATVFFAE